MNKFKKFLESIKRTAFGINFALIAFVAYLSKIMVFKASFADVGIFLAISGLYGYTIFLSSKKPDPVRVNEELEYKINDINKKLSDVQMRQNLQKKPIKW